MNSEIASRARDSKGVVNIKGGLNSYTTIGRHHKSYCGEELPKPKVVKGVTPVTKEYPLQLRMLVAPNPSQSCLP